MSPSSKSPWWQPLVRPKSFLSLTTVQSGTQIIAFITLFNKFTAVYGLLGLLTGYTLSALQLVAFLYSLVAVILLLVCIPHISSWNSPLPNLFLAWLYVIDTFASAAFTAAFAGLWLVEVPPPEVSQEGKEEVAWMSSHETDTSLVLVVLFTIVRLYFCVVVMAHASSVVRNAVQRESGKEGAIETENPFVEGNPSGQGWKGKLGRGLVSVGKGYWLGDGASSADGEYARIGSEHEV